MPRTHQVRKHSTHPPPSSDDEELPSVEILPGESYVSVNGAKPTDPGVFVFELRVDDSEDIIKMVVPADRAEHSKALVRDAARGRLT